MLFILLEIWDGFSFTPFFNMNKACEMHMYAYFIGCDLFVDPSVSPCGYIQFFIHSQKCSGGFLLSLGVCCKFILKDFGGSV